MKLKHLFVLNAVLTLPFGLGSLIAPQAFLSLFGATSEPAAVLMMQYGGAWLIGMVLITWSARNVREHQTVRGIAVALFVAYVIGLVVGLLGQRSGVLNLLGWLPVALHAVYVLGYGYFLCVRREAIEELAMTPRARQT